MTKSYVQIQQQIEQLQRQADQLRKKEVAGVIARIKEAIATYDLSAADLGLAASRQAGVGAKATTGGRKKPAGRKVRQSRRAAADGQAPKYRDASGQVWGGRGPRPRWLREAIAAGRSLQEFAV